jgi:phosphopantothenoylcysteine decarboxylase/phosphopantothenate--cysteine ligase
MACGIADDMLSTTVLATKAPIIAAPAMNTGMWTAAATQANISLLRERGVQFIGPDSGILACGDEGAGRMSEPEDIVAEIDRILNAPRDLSGLKVLITAGATRERLDPVRFLTNDSSGKMGFALAEAARDRGAEVTVVCGSVSVPVPYNTDIIRIESAENLLETMSEQAPLQDIIIQAAAVADYRPLYKADQKIKKKKGQEMILTLVENPDVAREVGKMKKPGQTLVGFAAETNRVQENAKEKLDKKNLDLIVANDVTVAGAGFNTDTNIATLISKKGIAEYPLMSKRKLADIILDTVLEIRKGNQS